MYFWPMEQGFTHSIKHFNELSAIELYEIIRLRNEVFVVEQNCVFQDADNKDQHCYHLMLRQNDVLVAYTRLVPKGISYPDYMSIGRVVSSPAARRTGAGRAVMEVSIEACYRLWGQAPIKIGAQLYLKQFYASFGFVAEGEIYLEDGIEHIEMVL